jgi:hypothetical protein
VKVCSDLATATLAGGEGPKGLERGAATGCATGATATGATAGGAGGGTTSCPKEIELL